MFEKIIAFFKGAKWGLFTNAMDALSPILDHLEANYQNDKDAKNALIDTFIQILQAHKE